jgi:histone H3/H4
METQSQRIIESLNRTGQKIRRRNIRRVMKECMKDIVELAGRYTHMIIRRAGMVEAG